MAWVDAVSELLWANVWTVIPLALLTAGACRWLPCRPATRHVAWVVVLAWFLIPQILPASPLARWLAAHEAGEVDEKVAAAAGVMAGEGTEEGITAKNSAVVDDGRREAERTPLSYGHGADVGGHGVEAGTAVASRGDDGAAAFPWAMRAPGAAAGTRDDGEIAEGRKIPEGKLRDSVRQRSAAPPHGSQAAPASRVLQKESASGDVDRAVGADRTPLPYGRGADSRGQAYARGGEQGWGEKAGSHDVSQPAASVPPVTAPPTAVFLTPAAVGADTTLAEECAGARRAPVDEPRQITSVEAASANPAERTPKAIEPSPTELVELTPQALIQAATTTSTEPTPMASVARAPAAPAEAGEAIASPAPSPELAVSRDRVLEAAPIALPGAPAQELVTPNLNDAPAPEAGATTPDAAPAPQRVSILTTLDQFRQQWLGGLAQVRAIVGVLPALPPLIWFGGAALFAGLALIRLVWFCWLMRKRQPAPGWVKRETAQIARRLKLRRAPEVTLVDRAVSPLVWCGGRPRVVLPASLWGELDRQGRRAILCHELAHLRRRDHWVCWLELIVGALYWWHPVVWWARKRIHEEADLSCDAWVTWLMPQGRRAYAEALLQTRAFVQTDCARVAAVSGAVTTGAGRRLARRLTMVMTERVRPRQSLIGTTLGVTLLLAGWMATPAFSCPPKDKEKDKEGQKIKKAEDGKGDALTATQRADEAEGQPAVIWTTAERPPRGEAGRAGGPTPPAGVYAPAAPRAARAPRAPGMPGVPRAPLPEGPAVAPLPPLPPEQPAPEAHSFGFYPSGRGGPGDPGEFMTADREISRVYRLPEGKLDALTELMIRQDVPIRVRRVDDGLEVFGTPAQHEVVESFVSMIHEDQKMEWEEYALPEGKLAALSQLMVRNDVPVLVSPRENHIRVQGTKQQQRIFRNFVELLQSGRAAGSGVGQWDRFIQSPPEAIERFRAQQELARQQEEELRRRFEAQQERHDHDEALRRSQEHMRRTPQHQQEQDHLRHDLHAQLEGHRHGMDALREQTDVLRRQSEELRHEGEKLRRESEHMRQRGEELKEAAEEEESDSPQRRAVEQQVRRMERQAHEIERQADALERQADRLEEQAERLEEQSQQMEERLHELHQQLEELDQDLDRDHDEDEEREETPRPPREQRHGALLSPPFHELPALTYAEALTSYDVQSALAPTIAAALEEAAVALRSDAAAEVRLAFAEAAAEIRQELREEVAPELRELDAAHGTNIAELVVRALEQIATTLEGSAANAIGSSLERAAETMSQRARELREHEQGRRNAAEVLSVWPAPEPLR